MKTNTKKLTLLFVVAIILTLAFMGLILFDYDNDVAFAEENSDFSFTIIGDNECSVRLKDSELTIAVIPEYVEINGKNYDVTTVAANGFASASLLTKVRLPDTITSIGNAAFMNCPRLSSIALSSVETIGMNAFAKCPMLEQLIIPQAVTTIGNNILRYNDTHVYVRSNNMPNGWAAGWNNGNADQEVEYSSDYTPDVAYKSMHLARGLNTLSVNDQLDEYYIVSSFQEFTEIREDVHVHIPDRVGEIPVAGIEWDAFYGNHISVLTIEYSETPIFLDDLSFFQLDCDTIIINRDIVLECDWDSMISESIFATSKVSTIVLPNSLTQIGPSMFDRCVNLKDIHFISPHKIKLQGNDDNDGEEELAILNDFSSTQIVELPDSVTVIGKQAFVDTKKIKELYVPSSVIEVGLAAFSGWEQSGIEQYIFLSAESEQDLPSGWVQYWNSGCAQGVIQYNGTYNIFYHPDNLKHNNPQMYTSRDTIILNDIDLLGYTFEGWFENEDFIGERIFKISKGSSGDIHLYAKIRSNTYTVYYESNMPEEASHEVVGDTVQSIHIYGIASTLRPVGFRLTGWTFKGWMDGEGKEYDDEQVVINLTYKDNDIIKFYAIWKANSYTVTYNSNKPDNTGGKVICELNEEELKSEYSYDKKSKLLANPFALAGWTFVKWKGSDGRTFEDEQEIENLCTGELPYELKAQWSANVFQVVYKPNLNGVQEIMPASKFTYDQEASLSPCAYTAEHYKFIEWKADNGNIYEDCANVKNIIESGEITLYAQWEPESCHIKFIATYDGSVAYSEKDYKYGESIEFPEATRKDSLFRAWANSLDVDDIATLGSVTARQDFAYYTTWTVAVHYDYNGGSSNGSYSTREVVGRVIQLPSSTHVAYLSGEWDIGKFGANYIVENPINAKANWTNPKEFTITYEGLESELINEFHLKTSYTIESETIFFPVITKPGFKSSLSETNIPTGSYGDKVIYVYWQAIKYHFYAVTGGDMQTVQIDSFGAFYGHERKVTAPNYDGYTFKRWQNEKGEFISDSKTVTVKNPTLIDNANVVWTAIYVEDSCIAKGTLITLADGSQKAVEDLAGDEMLLVWNLHTGKFDAAPILFIDRDLFATYTVINLTFSDGSNLKVISEHGLWDYNLNKYVYLDESASQYIGHWFNKQSLDDAGNIVSVKVQLTDVRICDEQTMPYSPVTYGHMCYYVNGLLSMPGGIDGLFNIFEVDGESMRYNEMTMEGDIAEYGLYTYEEFVELVPVTEEMFNAVQGQYLKVAVGKGLITIDDIRVLVDRYSIFFE